MNSLFQPRPAGKYARRRAFSVLYARGKGAFSLPEILIVIIILAVIALISFPVMGTLKNNRQSLQCINNLRQIGVGLNCYTGEFNGMVPPRYLGLYLDVADRPRGNERAWYSRLYTFGYVKNADAFYCPAFPPRSSREAQTAITAAIGDTYAMRNWIVPGRPWEPNNEEQKPLTAIQIPADFFLVVDSVWLGWKRQGYGVAPGNKDQNIHFRHEKKANALFADGHVEGKPADYFRSLGSGAQAAYGTGRDFSLYEKKTVD